MNRDGVEERLLDLALVELLGRAAGPATTTAPRRASPLVAACMVIGVAVVLAVAWSMRTPAATEVPFASPQDPSVEPTRVVGRAGIEKLPAATRDLQVALAEPAEIEALARLRLLRRLDLQFVVTPGGNGPDNGAWWRKHLEARQALRLAFAGADVFSTLGSLRTLESLHLPPGLPSTPEQLAFLRRLQVRSLSFLEVDLRSAGMRDALVAAPSCRELRLIGALVDAPLFAALRPLHLERLELLACSGLDDVAWQAIARLETLQHLEVTSQTGGSVGYQGANHPLGTLGDAAFDALAGLPALRHLGLDESAFPDDLLVRLPASLQSLDLGHRPMREGAARMLRRLTGLRRLTFGCGLDEASACAVLPSWSLEQLDYRGKAVGSRLLAAIAAQPGLQELALHVGERVDLTPLANAPRLRVLELRSVDPWRSNAPGLSLAQLAPLAECKGLRRLRLRDSKLDLAQVRARLGDRMVVDEVLP